MIGKRRAALETKLTLAATAREKIDLLNELAVDIILVDVQKGFEISMQAKELSSTGEFSRTPYQPGLAKSLMSLPSRSHIIIWQ